MKARVLPLIILSLALAACSPFQRDFRRVADEGRPDGPTGAWQGRWTSEMNGHSGPLWCLVSPTVEEGGKAGRFDFRYRAGWGMFRFGDYTHRGAGWMDGGVMRVGGEMKLPDAVGTYRIDGTLSPDRFSARFESDRGDRGRIELSRP